MTAHPGLPVAKSHSPATPAKYLLPACVFLALCCSTFRSTRAEEQGTPQQYLNFIKARAAALHKADHAPETLDAWKLHKQKIRQGLLDAWGGFPADPSPLQPKVLGTLQRDGYRIEKIAFQTLPGVWMTANAYVPDSPGKHAAILAVHGHWPGAKQDPVVQARCIGPVKLGFFVLAVDAFGAGERGIGKALGEYHGAMTGATLLPIGLPLSGIQVYENSRAIDYLQSRAEVDPERIGITGASGGGNQTMYAGAWDERLKAAVPVCSIGNYQAYLGRACCMCEVVPGALRFAEEWGVLGLIAPRGLLVVSATRDGPQFAVNEAKTSLALATPVFQLEGAADHVRHAIFESGHDYNKAMREAMYGWMTLHLNHEGSGSPIAEAELKLEDPQSLRCYPGTSRPDDWITIPRFAAAHARQLLAARPAPADQAAWNAQSEKLRASLIEKTLGGFPDLPPVTPRVEPADGGRAQTIRFESEPGITLSALVESPSDAASPSVIVLDLNGASAARKSDLAQETRRKGWGLVTLDLRATGALAPPGDGVRDVPDHNTGEWALWLGRPLLGQWVVDVRRLLDTLERTDDNRSRPRFLAGIGPAGIVALCAGAVDPRVAKVATLGTLASYVTEEPYAGQRLGIMAPGIVRDIGDVAHLAALSAPKTVVVAGAMTAGGQPLALESLRTAFRDATRAWDLLGASQKIAILATPSAVEVLQAFQ